MKKTLKVQRVINTRLDELEQKQLEGWSNEMLVEMLVDEGIKIDLPYFKLCLHKARALLKQGKLSGKPVKPEGSAAAPVVAAPAGEKGGATTQRPPSPASQKTSPAQGKFQMRKLDKDELF